MPIGARYLFMVSMDVAPDKEDLFNEVYDGEHIPNLLKVPGVIAVTRVRSEPFAVSMAGSFGSARCEGNRSPPTRPDSRR